MLALGLSMFQSYPLAVEQYYSRAFYPLFSYLSKYAFAWLPFSVGDLFYVAAIGLLLYLLGQAVFHLFKKRIKSAFAAVLWFLCLSLSLYVYFYLSWGMNYYREPLATQLDLRTDSIKKADYLLVLAKYVEQTNNLRAQLAVDTLLKEQARTDLSAFMLSDTLLAGFLSKTQAKVKSPVSSHLVSFFTVTGYFNPFTQEVQVNSKIPTVAYPFTVVHELAHQMGVGFEDECNFIAFLKLKDHPNIWYRYAANYETMQYLLRPLYFQDPDNYKLFVEQLSAQVVEDINEERAFWSNYTGWFNTLTDVFYTGYLKHNNQPEGMKRYSMMSRLVVAWEMRNMR